MAVQAALQANLTAQAQRFGLTVTQAAVAQDLGQHPGSTLQEVCERLGWPKSTVSRVVDDLVNRGFVLRQIPASNRRIVLLSLDHGAVGCVPSDFEGIFLGGLPDDPREVESLVACLDRIHKMLGVSH